MSNLGPFDTDIRKIVQAILQLFQGRSDSVGTVTLRAGQTTTVVTKAVHAAAVNMNPSSAVFYSALTANAAAVAYSLWTSNRVIGGFTINHANDANADKIFSFEIRGGE